MFKKAKKREGKKGLQDKDIVKPGFAKQHWACKQSFRDTPMPGVGDVSMLLLTLSLLINE